jgi:uncharacterized protein YndB with AHSA1/START domain
MTSASKMSKPETAISTPSEREVVLTRSFDAPRELVFRALTEPALLMRWYGQTGWQLVECELDLRVGCEFHFVSQRPNGKRVGQRGVYREITPPRRLVHTEWWDDWNPGECLVSVELHERARQTVLTSTTLFPTREVRDTILESGLKRGVEELYGKLSELLTEL